MSRPSLVPFLLATMLVSSAYADTSGKVVCADADGDKFLNDVRALIKRGYNPVSEFTRKKTATYVGTGLKLDEDTKGVIAVGTVKGSSSDATGMFGTIAYRVMAVDGVFTAGKSIDDVREMIIGPLGTGVVVTFKQESYDRTYERYLERKHITHDIYIHCFNMELSKK